MKTELFLREKITLGDFNNAETYVNITYTDYQYFEFNPNGTPVITSNMPIYIFDSSSNLVGSFTIDSWEELSPTQWAIYITEVFDFTGMSGLILTQSPTYFLQRNIDLFDDISIPTTYAIADIQDISKKSSAKTTTIKIPGTPNNNKMFKNVFYLPTTNTYILNKTVDAVVLFDTSTLIEGVFMLTKVVKLRDNIQYEGVIYTSIIGLFEAMGDKLLYGNADSTDDLDFSEYTHVLNGTNILNSLTTTPGSGYTYIPIDKFGKWNLEQQVSVNNVPPVPGNYKYSELTLSLFIKEIWDKIFQKYGFTYQSDFMEDLTYNPSHHAGDFEFKRLIYPNISQYNELSDLEAKNRSVKLKDSAINSLSIPASPSINPMFNLIGLTASIVENTGSIYNSSTGIITIPDSGYYNLDLSYISDIWLDTIYPNLVLQVGYAPGGYENISISVQTYITVNGSIMLDDQGIPISTTQLSSNFKGPKVMDSAGNFKIIDMSDTLVSFKVVNRKFNAGDIIEIKSNVGSVTRFTQGGFQYYAYIYLDGVMYKSIPIQIQSQISYAKINLVRTKTIVEGNTINPTIALGKKMKQSDFINSIIKMFNLYIEPASPNNMLISPRDYYYSTTVEESWSPKLDISNPIDIERTSDIVDKKVNIRYKRDKDYFNELYTNQYSAKGLGYGEYLQESSINTRDNYTIDISFAPTICGPLNNPDWYVGNQLNNCECPKIFTGVVNDNTTSTLTDDLTVSYKEYEPRILYWQGLVEKLITSTGNYANGNIRIYNDNYTSQITIPTGYFPNASMFDKPFGADEFTLDFANNDKYWVNLNGTNPTYQNMYWMYYRNMINEYTDPDGKLVTLYIYLTDKDIAQLNFSNFYMIDGVRYHLNKIENFVPNRPTKIELIKIP